MQFAHAGQIPRRQQGLEEMHQGILGTLRIHFPEIPAHEVPVAALFVAEAVGQDRPGLLQRLPAARQTGRGTGVGQTKQDEGMAVAVLDIVDDLARRGTGPDPAAELRIPEMVHQEPGTGFHSIPIDRLPGQRVTLGEVVQQPGLRHKGAESLGLGGPVMVEMASEQPLRRDGGAPRGQDFVQKVMPEPGNIDWMVFIGGWHARPAP